MGQHARLAAARTGQDQEGTLTVRYGLALGLVQARQQLLEVLCVGVVGHPSSIGAAAANKGEVRTRYDGATDARISLGYLLPDPGARRSRRRR